VSFGSPYVAPVTGDWLGDGETSIGVVQGDDWRLRPFGSKEAADLQLRYGVTTDVPVTGRW
jgi:hypothetical protein